MVAELNVYLQFHNQAAEALHFYQNIFGGEVSISTFADFDLADNPDDAGLVMHGMIEADSGFSIMASDTPKGMEYTPLAGVSLALFGSLDDEAELRGYWEKLAEGGVIRQPLEFAPWGDFYGELVDKYGVRWMFDFGNPPDD